MAMAKRSRKSYRTSSMTFKKYGHCLEKGETGARCWPRAPSSRNPPPPPAMSARAPPRLALGSQQYPAMLNPPPHATICRKELAAAIWRPQHRGAEVVLQRGRLFSHMGFIWGKKLFLHPEEAL